MLPYINKFIADREQYCAPRTVKYYGDCLEKFSDFTDNLHPDIYGEYVRHLRKQKISNTSVRTYARGVKVYLHWLLDNELVDDIKLIKQSKLPRKDARIVQPLTTQEVKTIDASVKSERDFLVIHLMLDCGLRRGEVRGLEWQNIDLESGLLRVERTKSADPRLVPIPSWLVFRLKDYKLCGGTRPFQLTENAIKMMFQKLKKRSGITRIHAHLLRHTFGTSFIYYKMGDLYRLALLMGHKEISTTCNYLHLAAMYDLQQVDIYKLDEVFQR